MAIAPAEDLVFTQGDYCLPNIMIDEEFCYVLGFVDLRRAGIADRYYEVAVCLRSIQYNIGDGYNQNAIYLFNTEDNDNVEFYDCIILENIPYCRRPGFPIDLYRNNGTFDCSYKGTLWTFERLRLQNITHNKVLHEYQSSIEKAEEYALYLSLHKNSSFLCECPKRNFGKNCEYQLISENWFVTFESSRNWQNGQKKKNRLQMQAYQKTLCYTTLICDYGLLCLDWRDICDGRQQCMNGTDEEACDFLEFNECEDDEYRCSNGMCIPDIYFLDGEYDCMDYSDEQQSFDHSVCGYQSDSLNCDEHICSVREWSCGDGQCISERNRYEWQEYTTTTSNVQCHSMREYMYMCELSDRFKLWTSINGTCYDSSLIDLINEKLNKLNQTSDKYCLYLIKCTLSDGVEKNCPCRRLTCDSLIKQNCSSTIKYPEKGLLTPYLIGEYVRERKWPGRKQPDFYTMSGSIRCRGYYGRINVNNSIWITTLTKRRNIELEDLFCNHPSTLKDIHGLQYHYSSCYANVSYTLGRGLPYAFFDVCQQCISQYRINDGTQDCLQGEDERPQKMNTCTNRVRHHRYQCFTTLDTCLMIKVLGDSLLHCNQGDDEIDFKSGQSLSMTMCKQYEDEECRFLREYIFESKHMIDNNTDLITNAKMPFRSYCNTFWDLKDKSDELVETCRFWMCAQNEFQCGTNQCIPKSYVCDGEWDCNDASDELFDINQLSRHNQMIYLEKQIACARMKNNTVQPFGNFCNIITEYPCLLNNFTEQSDPIHTRPCINISQIGDNHIDCLGGFDERNTLSNFNGIHQLGYAFQCRSTPDINIDDQQLCANTSRCDNQKDDLALCGDRHENCSNLNDFLCINGSCIKDARCNRKIECEHGEDEYGCNPNTIQTGSKHYRILKRQDQKYFKKYIVLPTFPSNTIEIKTIIEKEKPIIVKRDIPVNLNPSIVSLLCNRGVAALHYTNTVICFCPPSYYGEYCEYHNDRLTSYVHLNVSHSVYTQPTTDINLTLRVLVLLIYENQIIHSQQFNFRPAYDIFPIIKKKHFLIYSREVKLLEKKIYRNWNRSSIINHFPYSLQYEAYELKMNNEINFVGVWRYPLYFDFLPSFRFAKTLRFLQKQPDSLHSPCYSNPCNSSNAECHILQNDPTKYICLCKSGYSGKHCSIQDQYCENKFCHSNALCKPTYLGSVAGSRLPLCVCPLNTYGTRCGLIYDQCRNNPCKNHGTCYPSTSDIAKSYCICHKDYYGTQCELKKEAFDLIVHVNNVSGLSVVQYFYIDYKTLNLAIARQDIYEQPSRHLHYQYEKTYGPQIIILKNYPTGSATYPDIFLLSLTINEKNINSSTNLTDENLCLNIRTIFNNILVYQYHNICRNHSTFVHPLCFFDDQYLCFCDVNNNRAECFIYDHKLDQCDYCFSNGRCIRGDLQDDEEYLCICPECHYGHRCQYNSEQFSFTFEQIFTRSLLSRETVERRLTFYCMILVACIYFIIGAFNNLFTFVTFYRSKFLRTGVGNYLLVGSVINQINIVFLALRLIHVVLNAIGYMNTVNVTTNTILCKFAPYILTSSGQLSYWLMSTVAIERLYITWRIRGIWLKKAYVARRIMFTLTFIILIINGTQIVFYKALFDTKTEVKSVTCVLIYSHHFWIRLNQVNNYINSFLPLIINIICTSGIMFLIIRQKLLANKKSTSPTIVTDKQAISEAEDISPIHISSTNIDIINQKQHCYVKIKNRWNFFRTVLQENRDLIFGPAMTIVPQLFSLPQLIFSSTMSCHDFANEFVRFSFIISLFILYIPQVSSFLLYVKSSSIYYAHFRSTFIGKKVLFLLHCCRRQIEPQHTYSVPSRYKISNTIKYENSFIIDNTIQH